jgi:predicted anti-sigma-YlaC factor YlaD
MIRSRSLCVFLLLLALAACSPKRIGINRMADALTATATSYGRDDDIELVRAAAPATLKLVEMMLDEAPTHEGLLSTACSGFTQYAYGFLQIDAEIAEPSNPVAASELKARAARMYARARGYCGRALDVRHRGFRTTVLKEPAAAVARAERADVSSLVWLAVSWGGEISLSNNPLSRLQELVAVRVVLARALDLDEAWQRGAIHEALIAFDGMPMLLGGSPDRARKHFDRAVELSAGQSAFAYVTMASSVSLPAGNRAGFEQYLKAALAVDANRDTSLRLTNLIAQKRARFLLSRSAALFPRR